MAEEFPHRLGESQADQGSVEEACAQNVQGVEADRVPHTNVRSQLLPGNTATPAQAVRRLFNH